MEEHTTTHNTSQYLSPITNLPTNITAELARTCPKKPTLHNTMKTPGKERQPATNFIARETLIRITVMARKALIKQKNAYVAAPRSVPSLARNANPQLNSLSRIDKLQIKSSAREMLVPTAVMARGALASKQSAPAATPRSVSPLAKRMDSLLTLPSCTHQARDISGATSPVSTATS
jgi:hypothetical protein